MKKSFTLVEILIVVALIGIIAASAPLTIDFMKQTQKAQDTKRKQDLITVRNTMEDYYNDKGSYPSGVELCEDAVQVDAQGTCSCHVCGRAAGPSSLPPYLTHLPCDPQYPTHTYLYQYECSTRQWYKLYANLSPVSSSINGYNHAVSSSNINSEPYPTSAVVITPTPLPPGESCVYCGDEIGCKVYYTPQDLTNCPSSPPPGSICEFSTIGIAALCTLVTPSP